MMVTVVAWITVAVLGVELMLAGGIGALRGTPRSGWLSFAGGVAIAYVFLKLLPELTRAQFEMMRHYPSAGWLRGHLLFLVALAGATALFGIERAAKQTKARRKERGEEARSAAWVFLLHGAVMAAYVGFIAYLLFRGGEQHLRAVAVLGGVMAMHFSGIAVALTDDYGSLYTAAGRWALTAAILAGGGIGYARKLPETAHHLVLSPLAGAVIFSVVKEEIPPERQSRFWAFAVGVALAGCVLWFGG